MDFFKLVDDRRSMRKYAGTAVEKDKLHKILATANKAPSAGNLQAYEIYVVQNLEDRQALVKASWDQAFLAEAPVVLIFCAHPARNEEKYGERGTGLRLPVPLPCWLQKHRDWILSGWARSMRPR
jgi:nitroreductase